MIPTPDAIAQSWQFIQAGHLEKAEQSARQAVAASPQTPNAWYALGVACQLQGKLDDAVGSYRQALDLHPEFAEAHNNLGAAYAGREQWQDAASCYRRALQIRPTYVDALNNLGVALINQGQPAEAVQCLCQALQIRPPFADAHNNMGVALQSLWHLAGASAAFREAIRYDPTSHKALYNLANVLAQQGNLDEAVDCYHRALQIYPGYADAQNNLARVLNDRGSAKAFFDRGEALQRHGCLEEAIACFHRALELQPRYTDAYNHMGICLFHKGKLDEAETSLRRGLAVDPKRADALINLGNVLDALRRPDEAVDCYRRALELLPNAIEANNNLGVALVPQGLLEEAVECYRRALAAKPDFASAHSNILVARNYDPAVDPDTLFAEHLDWAARHGRVPRMPPPAHDRDPVRRLRVGYASPDFRQHPVAHFLKPIFAHTDPSRIETYCYAEVSAPDPITNYFQSRAAGWRNTTGRSDSEVAEQIRADEIDILVDLAGHTGGNRLLVFARKPSPVQVTYMGYPNTTGLETVDFRLTDAIADPPGEPVRAAEELVRLAYAYCYAPPESAPAVSPTPCHVAGHVTFGSFHNLAKLNARVLDLWCKLLNAIPTARLLVFRHTLVGRIREHFDNEFRHRGLDDSRFELRTAADGGGHLNDYAKVDIALDAFPWNGHTTACESLWMGVPVITLYGDLAAGRLATGTLTAVGLPELIAKTTEEYVKIAVELARDCDRLTELRSSLRERMQTSPLCDGPAFTRSLEQTYRTLWRRRCAS